MRVKMSKPPPPAPTASAIGHCPTVIKIVGRPGTGSLPRTIASPDHPTWSMAYAVCHAPVPIQLRHSSVIVATMTSY